MGADFPRCMARQEMIGQEPCVERFLLIRPGALGDALLTLPALALLRRERPGARVTLVARGDVLPLARASALADAAYDWSDPVWAALFTDEPAASGVAHEPRAVVRDAAVVAWLGDAEGAVARNLASWDARQVVIAPGRPPLDDQAPYMHTALLLAKALAPLDIAVPATAEALAASMPPLRLDPHDECEAARAWDTLDLAPEVGPVVALHAGSGGATKRWPPERFAALARRLIARGCHPLLIEGPADEEVTTAVLAEQARLGTLAESVPVARGLRVGTLAALLRRCMAYAGNDSGVSHLAALGGVSTLALFGPSDPTRWAPLGSRVRILRAPEGDMAALQIHRVWEALLGILEPKHPHSLAR